MGRDMSQYGSNYQLARTILRLLLYMGFALVALGIVLTMMGLFFPKAGLFSAEIEFRYGRSRPLWVLLLDLLPGLCALGYGLMVLVAVYVAGAILDVAETNSAILQVQKTLLSHLSNTAGEYSPSNQATTRRKEPDSPVDSGNSAGHEVYKRKLITRNGNYFYVDGIKFTDVMSAKAYIDNSVNLPPAPRPPG